MPGMPKHAQLRTGDAIRKEISACSAGTTTYSAAVPNGRWLCAPRNTRPAHRPWRRKSRRRPRRLLLPHRYAGQHAGKAFPLRTYLDARPTSPGLTPEAATRMRTSPDWARGLSFRPRRGRWRARPARSYQAAFMRVEAPRPAMTLKPGKPKWRPRSQLHPLVIPRPPCHPVRKRTKFEQAIFAEAFPRVRQRL